MAGMATDTASLPQRRALEDELMTLGRERADLLTQAAALLPRIVELLPQARQLGLHLTDVASLTGVSRPTLYAHQPNRSAP